MSVCVSEVPREINWHENKGLNIRVQPSFLSQAFVFMALKQNVQFLLLLHLPEFSALFIDPPTGPE